MTVTIHNTGRPMHDFRIHTDTNQRPSSADCTCGARWHHGVDENESVMEWGMTHVQPDPDTAHYNRIAAAHATRKRYVRARLAENPPPDVWHSGVRPVGPGPGGAR